MNLSCMPEFLISNRASEASEKILEKMWGKSYRPLAQWKWNAITLVTSDCSYMCTTKKYRKKSTPWPLAYFTNGPNAAASIAPTLIRHCRWHLEFTPGRDFFRRFWIMALMFLWKLINLFQPAAELLSSGKKSKCKVFITESPCSNFVSIELIVCNRT